MNVVAGSSLGPYEIVAPIGAGGMGEVWKGRDTRLEREVAIKILPPALAHDEQFRARFEREARVISALKHPNICTLYDIGQEDGTSFLVMELLEGDSLATRLEKGALPLDQALRYGAQIAQALAHAHQQGVVHRDLKPGNVMLTREGAKLLDFGLARVGVDSVAVRAREEMPTVSAPLTVEGALVGTFQYMAPEQFDGAEADSRTDIFALGAVLYEMTTGHPAFSGETTASLIAAIVTSQPEPVISLAPSAPATLDHIIGACLEKDPEDRWQSAHDIARELRWIGETGVSGSRVVPTVVSAASRRKNRRALIWILAGAALLLGALWWRPPSAPPASYRLSLPVRTVDYAETGDAHLSPDGTRVALWLRSHEGTWQWGIRDLATGMVEDLDGMAGLRAAFLCWSPSGDEVAMMTEKRLMAVDADTGSVRDIGEGTARPAGGSWNRDDVILYADMDHGIYRVSAHGGSRALVAAPDPDRFEVVYRAPHFLPNGDDFLFTVITRDPSETTSRNRLRAGSLGSTETVEVGEVGSAVAVLDSGYLVHVTDGTLTARRFDARRLRLSDRPIPIAEGVDYHGPTGNATFSASRNGTLLYRKREINESVVWFGPTGEPLGPLAATGKFTWVDISPDGRQAAIHVNDLRTGTADIFLYGLDRDTNRKLTVDPRWEGFPSWTPDGGSVVFSSDWQRQPDIYVARLDSSTDAVPVFGTETFEYVTDVSPDGQHILFRTPGPAGDWDLWFVGIDGEDGAQELVSAPTNQWGGTFSANGEFVAYASLETGRSEIWLRPFPAGNSLQITTTGGRVPAWSTARMTLFYARGRGIYAVDLETPAQRSRPQPRLLFEAEHSIRMFDVAPDGRFLIILRDESIVEPNHFILNWRPPAN